MEEGHFPQLCRKCYAESGTERFAWNCQFVNHAVSFHPRLVEIRVNMPDDPAPLSGGLIGTIRIPEE